MALFPMATSGGWTYLGDAEFSGTVNLPSNFCEIMIIAIITGSYIVMDSKCFSEAQINQLTMTLFVTFSTSLGSGNVGLSKTQVIRNSTNFSQIYVYYR